LQQAGLQLQANSEADRTALENKRLDLIDERQQEELNFRKLQWKDEPARQLQAGLQQQQLLEKNIQWQYTESQKREKEKVTEAVAWLRNEVGAGRWTAEQAEQAEQQLWQKYHSIIPLPTYDNTPKTEDLVNRDIYTNPITGIKMLYNRQKGTLEPMPGAISLVIMAIFMRRS